MISTIAEFKTKWLLKEEKATGDTISCVGRAEPHRRVRRRQRTSEVKYELVACSLQVR
jgi:hypothetical protein